MREPGKMYSENTSFNPKVSILIATYNQPQYIEDAVKSALSQDYNNLEVVVSDDSENNDTGEILNSYLADQRFSYHKNEKNIGRVANYRRLLYELATGEWVMVLDGDDYYIDNSYISKAINTIKKDRSIVMVGGGHEVYNENTNATTINQLVANDVVFDGTEVFISKLSLPQHSTNIYLRSVACKINFYRHPSAGSDAESLFRLCLHGRVSYLSNIVSVWRIHQANATYGRNINDQLKDLDFINSVYEYAKTFVDIKILRDWSFSYYKGMSYHLADAAVKTDKFTNIIRVVKLFYKYWGFKDSGYFLMRQFYRAMKKHSNQSVVFK